MTAKRWEIINEEFISYTGGTAQLISNGECEIHLWENPKDAQLFCDKLNAINKENEQLKTTIQQLRTDNTKQKKKLNTTMKENEQLKCGNKNLKATLNDFINICNRLQANPTDKQTLGVARDMLQNMGVDLE